MVIGGRLFIGSMVIEDDFSMVNCVYSSMMDVGCCGGAIMSAFSNLRFLLARWMVFLWMVELRCAAMGENNAVDRSGCFLWTLKNVHRRRCLSGDFFLLNRRFKRKKGDIFFRLFRHFQISVSTLGSRSVRGIFRKNWKS